MDDPKIEMRKMLLKFMASSLKHSKICVPQPLPLVEEKAQKRLETDDLISWKQILKEWEKVTPEGKKEISKLLIINAYDLVEVLDLGPALMEDCKDTADYVKEHPEFEKSDEEISRDSIMDDFKDLLG